MEGCGAFRRCGMWRRMRLGWGRVESYAVVAHPLMLEARQRYRRLCNHPSFNFSPFAARRGVDLWEARCFLVNWCAAVCHCAGDDFTDTDAP